MNSYPKDNTALLIVDPYNDFMAKKGKAWPLVKKVANEVDLHNHMTRILAAARAQSWSVFYAPHHQYREGSFAERKFLHPSQYLQKVTSSFAAGEFGSEFYPGFEPQEGDVVATQHNCSSGFAGTNLHQELQKKNISHVVIIGFLTNTCIESTARSAVDLGYHVTLLSDAVASWSPVDHDAGIHFSYPQLAHNFTDTAAFLSELN